MNVQLSEEWITRYWLVSLWIPRKVWQCKCSWLDNTSNWTLQIEQSNLK